MPGCWRGGRRAGAAPGAATEASEAGSGEEEEESSPNLGCCSSLKFCFPAFFQCLSETSFIWL